MVRNFLARIPQPMTPLTPGAKTKVRVIMGSALLFLLGPPLSPSGAGAKVVGSWSEEAEAEVSGGNPSFLPSLALTYICASVSQWKCQHG